MTGAAEAPEEERDARDIRELREFLAAPPSVRSLALVGLFVLACLYTAYFARTVLLTLTLAILLAFVLSPLVQGLRRLRIPEPAGAALVLVIFVGASVVAVFRLSGPAAEWVAKAPESLQQVEYKLRDIRQPVERVQRAAEEVQRVTDVGGRSAERAVAVDGGSTFTRTLLSQTWQFLGGAIVLVVLLYFLLASGDMFLRKLVRVIPRLEDKKRAVEIARQTRQDISTYLFTIGLVNVLLGGAVALAMALLDVPNPVLWGAVAGLLNFVPYLGAIATTVILGLVGLLTFDSLGRALAPPAAFLFLNLIEAYFLTPILLGRRLMLNTVVVFLGVIFWGWIWGIPGAILAVPILAAAKIVCDHVDPLQPVGEFLGR